MVGQLIERPSLLKAGQIPAQVKSICPKTASQKRDVRKYLKYYKRNGGKVGFSMSRGSAY